MSKNSSDYDFQAKIVVLGESGSGKTSISRLYCEGNFSEDYICTIGVDYKIKAIDIDGKKGKFQIWDTAGQERFRSLSGVYMRGASGIILYYAINNRESFEKVGYWMEEVKKSADEKDICMVLVGNKSDLPEERVVSFEEGKEWAESHGMKFFETSAKENLNVDDMFLALTKDISEVLSKKANDIQETGGTQLRPREKGNNDKAETKCFKCS